MTLVADVRRSRTRPNRHNVSTTVAEHNPLDAEERGVHPLVRFSPHDCSSAPEQKG